ncbi:TATA box-binding protein-associated factor RNA polymerase I subunit C [Megalops cyprinoides]|uniref:TATA box-binding protein-associated factor RNA polymerase I subunit C n=1 Tax=Megalops cyprinoides TaxID=118141 RepID=UPI001864D561|nr:TATA box-binding protein-associated factor RNA polymerase I subunit C [Megalops cyprinoides]
MDWNKFPHQLFPSFYNTGPPNAKAAIDVGGWGQYGQVLEVNHCLSEHAPGQLADLKFEAQHKVKGETWRPVEPTVAPFLPPNKAVRIFPGHPSAAMDFPEHMQNFYLENSQDAFGTMSSLLREHFYFGQQSLKGPKRENTVKMGRMKHFLSGVKYKKCPVTYVGKEARLYSHLFDSVIHDIPPTLLAELLHEELVTQKEREQFNEVATGGALGYFPLEVSDISHGGCLVYPGEASLSSLNFHKVVLEFDKNKPPRLSSKEDPFTIILNGTIRQISVGSMQECVHIGVRSDYLCGVWMASYTQQPLLLEVVQTQRVATCISVSPHIPGELLVTSEDGAAYLWTLGKGLLKFREEEGNLYFNAQSSWRWCDFSAHPRVMQYADRTGVELTDTRTPENCSYTLFRIGETPDCKRGERVILTKYLNDVHDYHHLVTTQHSCYIMDERFPCLPMVKWEHMMADPPMFAQVLPGSARGRSNKVLLGSQCSQELMLLQYSGGGETACCSVGPPQKLLIPRDSLSHLPAHIPHRQQRAQERLRMPAAGVTSIRSGRAEEYLFVLQLSEAGDIFYQMLTPQPDQVTADTVTSGKRSVDQGSGEPLEPEFASKGNGTASWELEAAVSDGDGEDTETQNEHRSPVAEDPASLSAHAGSGRDVTSLAAPSKKVLSRWKRWLEALFHRPERCAKHRQSLWTLKTKEFLSSRRPLQDSARDDLLGNLRRDLGGAMRRKGVLVRGSVCLPPPALAPLPDPVAPAEWPDDLSQRLTASWEGQWKSWWEEKLGMNREEKVAALRRKRRREKLARAGRRVGLSGSFTSSLSYQSDLDSLSGWSSAASLAGDSQGACSDVDGAAAGFSSQDACSEPKRANPPPSENRSMTLPSQPAEKAGSPSTGQRPTPSRRMKRPEQDYLSSLFSSHEKQHTGEESEPPFPLASSQQPSISSSQRRPRVLPSSQGSLSSQPKKKRSRMGF